MFTLSKFSTCLVNFTRSNYIFYVEHHLVSLTSFCIGCIFHLSFAKISGVRNFAISSFTCNTTPSISAKNYFTAGWIQWESHILSGASVLVLTLWLISRFSPITATTYVAFFSYSSNTKYNNLRCFSPIWVISSLIDDISKKADWYPASLFKRQVPNRETKRASEVVRQSITRTNQSSSAVEMCYPTWMLSKAINCLDVLNGLQLFLKRALTLWWLTTKNGPRQRITQHTHP